MLQPSRRSIHHFSRPPATSAARPLPDSFLLHALHFIRDVDRCDKYNKDTAPEGVPEAAEAVALTQSFFTPDVVLRIFDVLLNRFLAFSTEEHEKWEEDPEGFAIDEVGTGWQYVLKVRWPLPRRAVARWHTLCVPR